MEDLPLVSKSLSLRPLSLLGSRRATKSRMKATLIAVATLVTAASALPFGTKSPDGATEKQEMASVRGAAKEVSKSNSPEASAVVETFFESSSADSDSLQETLHAMANTHDMHDFLQNTRRSLHRHPEVMYELPFTSDTIAGILDELGVAYTRGWSKNTHPEVYEGHGGYGIVADIGSKSADEPCVILRAGRCENEVVVRRSLRFPMH